MTMTFAATDLSSAPPARALRSHRRHTEPVPREVQARLGELIARQGICALARRLDIDTNTLRRAAQGAPLVASVRHFVACAVGVCTAHAAAAR